ncbi:amidohydrolase family protein [Deinococcus radiophilus]|uniref:amidohydrolase family protein n=1 Tax=Deinococcus radiophilus TaxID=32062 RepID=UPI003614F2CD
MTGWLALPQGLTYGRLSFREGIEAVTPLPPQAGAKRYILPGFIDTHVHGGGGGDVMDGPAGVQTLCRLHARHGTTSLLPTTMTAPWTQVLAALRGVRQVLDLQAAGGLTDGAQVLGAHLEAPSSAQGAWGAASLCGSAHAGAGGRGAGPGLPAGRDPGA